MSNHVGMTSWMLVVTEISIEYVIAQKGRLRPFAVCQVLTFAKEIKVLIDLLNSLACETFGVLRNVNLFYCGQYTTTLPQNPKTPYVSCECS